MPDRLVATLEHADFLVGDQAKTLLRDSIKGLVLAFGITLHAWVILDNHYHLLIKTKHGPNLRRFFAVLHGGVSRQLNLRDGTAGRQVWHNYWDTCIRKEADYWTRFNYIHHNPVKHGYARDVRDWPFSSYHCYFRTKGEEWLADCWTRYPVVDYSEPDDFGRRPGRAG